MPLLDGKPMEYFRRTLFTITMYGLLFSPLVGCLILRLCFFVTMGSL